VIWSKEGQGKVPSDGERTGQWDSYMSLLSTCYKACMQGCKQVGQETHRRRVGIFLDRQIRDLRAPHTSQQSR
jgi:hypothetical protein